MLTIVSVNHLSSDNYQVFFPKEQPVTKTRYYQGRHQSNRDMFSYSFLISLLVSSKDKLLVSTTETDRQTD